MAKDEKKPVTISDCKLTDLDEFLKIKKKFRLTNGEAFAELIKNYLAKPEGSQQYEEKIIELETIVAEFDSKTENYNSEIEDLKSEINSLTNDLNKATAEKITLEKGQFIMFINSDAEPKVNRTIAAMIKEGKIKNNKDTRLQEFFTKAAVYLIKNEYSHILKD